MARGSKSKKGKGLGNQLGHRSRAFTAS